MQQGLQTHLDTRFEGMMTHMNQRLDVIQSSFDSNWDALNAEYSEFRDHIQTNVIDPIMTRLNNMQQSFQDNMGALSSQFDNLASSPLFLTPLALTTTTCILHRVISEASPLWQLMPKGERSEEREEQLSHSGY
jgi:hypothetical protein